MCLKLAQDLRQKSPPFAKSNLKDYKYRLRFLMETCCFTLVLCGCFHLDLNQIHNKFGVSTGRHGTEPQADGQITESTAAR